MKRKNKITNKICLIIVLLFCIYIINININININTNIPKKFIINHLEFENLLPSIDKEKKKFTSLKDIFNSRQLFINDADITQNYIKYIRPINETEEQKYTIKYSNNDINFDENYFQKRNDQYSYKDFYKLCKDEKLIDSNITLYDNKPLISVIIASYNKENIIVKSIRSIQNQVLKNIEIIIVDDGSTDNSYLKYKYLLETDPRIRVFIHTKNLGTWRTRLDGALYSRAKYIIFFDAGDFYEDNYVLEDYYNVIEKYNLDSLKMIFRMNIGNSDISNSRIIFHAKPNTKIVYGPENVDKLNSEIFKEWGNIWNRIMRANIFIKALGLVYEKVLNVYYNKAEDLYYNLFINKVSFSFLVAERVSYIYLKNGNGEAEYHYNTESERSHSIIQAISQLYFRYNLLPKNDTKSIIVKSIHDLASENNNPKLSYLRSKFYLLNNLLKILIEDPYVKNDDKTFSIQLLNKSIIRENEIKNNTFNK